MATDVPDLLVSLQASSIYEFEAVMRVRSSTAAGVKFAINFTDPNALAYALYIGAINATAGGQTITTSLGALGNGTFVAAIMDGFVTIKGMIYTDVNPGDFTVMQAKVTGGTATVRQGSSLKMRKIA